MTRLIRARIDSAALRANLTGDSRPRAAQPRDGGGQSQCLWPWAGADRAGAGRRRRVCGRAAGGGGGAARCRTEAVASCCSRGCSMPRSWHRPRSCSSIWWCTSHCRSSCWSSFAGRGLLSLWLKVDTGMNRLGFRPQDFRAAWERLRNLQPAPQQLRVLTHLACADEADGSYTAEQLARLRPLVAGLEVELSIANSAAILAQPSTHAAWVRPGLALYGVSPFAAQRGAQLGLRPAMTLESTVIALREVAAGRARRLRRRLARAAALAPGDRRRRLRRWAAAQHSYRRAGADRQASARRWPAGCRWT